MPSPEIPVCRSERNEKKIKITCFVTERIHGVYCKRGAKFGNRYCNVFAIVEIVGLRIVFDRHVLKPIQNKFVIYCVSRVIFFRLARNK
jgi:hypothetical protein